MMAWTFSRFHAAIFGCGMAVVSCLVTPAARLEPAQQSAFELPESLGSWELLEQGRLEDSEQRILQATDHWRRVYQCRETKHRVVVTLVAGAGGPLASHQPEICYARNEFCSHGEARLWTLPTRDDAFRFQTFQPRQIDRPALTIAYAWHDGDHWRAPRIPRLQLAGRAALQRLQVTMRHPAAMAADAQTAMKQFVRLTVDATDSARS